MLLSFPNQYRWMLGAGPISAAMTNEKEDNYGLMNSRPKIWIPGVVNEDKETLCRFNSLCAETYFQNIVVFQNLIDQVPIH